MRLQYILCRRLRPPQYGLATLLALVAVVSIPLAFWASAEHAYRVRRAAVDVIIKHGAVEVDDSGRDEWGPHCRSLSRIDDPTAVLGRCEVVVYAICSASDENIAAILRLPTLKALTLNDIGPGWSLIHPPVVPPRGAMDAPLKKIATLPRLETLYLGRTSVTDVGILNLAGTRSLRFLNLHETPITDAALEHLSRIPTLEELDLTRTAITDVGLRHLGSLTKLRVLNLSHTNVGGDGLVALRPLRRLERLNLSHTEVGDGEVRHLVRLVSLRDLDLAGTKISNAALTYLGQSASLQEINISGTAVTQDGIATFKQTKTPVSLLGQP